MKKLREIKNGCLYYNGYRLLDYVEKYNTPLKITFLGVIKEHIESLKKAFDESIKRNNYPAKFIYLNANKANYGKEEIETAFLFSDGLETSSYYDLLLTEKYYQKYSIFKNKLIVCNGFKLTDYLDKIVELKKNGYQIIDIIDSIEEYEYLKKQNIDLEIGLRIHLKALYSEDEVCNDRFGLNNEELDYIYNDLTNTKLVLSTIHYHQRGFDFEKDKFEENFLLSFNEYVRFIKKYHSLKYFDMGGGTPLPISEDFDYDKYADEVIKLLMDLCIKENIKAPHIISENGKYSQKDSTVNIYKVIGKKNTDDIPWYIVDGSLLIALPEMYALGEEVLVMPINKLDEKTNKARLAGVTCDCDDVLYDKKKFYLDLPNSDNLYIGLIGTGSYQNSMNGKGGVHHCLLPEEKDLIVDTDGSVEVRNELQTIEDICKIIRF